MGLLTIDFLLNSPTISRDEQKAQGVFLAQYEGRLHLPETPYNITFCFTPQKKMESFCFPDFYQDLFRWCSYTQEDEKTAANLENTINLFSSHLAQKLWQTNVPIFFPKGKKNLAIASHYESFNLNQVLKGNYS